MGRKCSTNGEKRSAFRILVAEREGRRPLGRPRHRWLNNMKWILQGNGPIRHIETCPDFFFLQEYTQQNPL
jgi:hypothetical protein